VSIIAASEQPLGKLEVTSFDLNGLAIYQSIGQLFSSRFQYSMEGRSRDSHLLSGLFLFQSLQILKADRLKFLK
jgi:hypothetical protein